VEPDPQQFWMIGGEAGADGESLLDGENRNIRFWVPVPQTWFVGQAS